MVSQLGEEDEWYTYRCLEFFLTTQQNYYPYVNSYHNLVDGKFPTVQGPISCFSARPKGVYSRHTRVISEYVYART